MVSCVPPGPGPAGELEEVEGLEDVGGLETRADGVACTGTGDPDSAQPPSAVSAATAVISNGPLTPATRLPDPDLLDLVAIGC